MMNVRQVLLITPVLVAVASAYAAPSSQGYRNVEYGFSVPVPADAKVEQPAAPGPAHGVVVHLESGAEIRVDGEYDAAMLGSVSAAARRVMEDESFVPAPRMRTVRTAGPAARCFGRVSDGTLQRRCVVYRARPDASSIIYTLALDGRARGDEVAFDRIVRGFRLEALPE